MAIEFACPPPADQPGSCRTTIFHGLSLDARSFSSQSSWGDPALYEMYWSTTATCTGP